MDAGDGTQWPDMRKIHSLREQIWDQTFKAVNDSLRGRTLPLPPWNLAHPAARTEKVHLSDLPKKMQTVTGSASASPTRCDVRIVFGDMLEEAGKLVEQGWRVAVLNMANAHRPGGGVKAGAGAQEENLHRRSDAFRYTEEQYSGNYPIDKDACLLSRGVVVFRGTEKNGYPFVPPFQIAMISCAAIAGPQLSKKNRKLEYKWPETEKLMRTKIAVIMEAAARSECDVVILSAFGCGAFGNPPNVVARLFHKKLELLPMSSLQQVVFCIFDDHNAYHPHNPEGNVQPFLEEFGLAALGWPESGPGPGPGSGSAAGPRTSASSSMTIPAIPQNAL